jgi:hypothetical protein
VYSQTFLHDFESKFGVEAPTIVTFLKRVLCYEFEIHGCNLKNENGDLFSGFKKEGFDDPVEVQSCEELLEMQKMLEELSTMPAPPFE